jgi:hypothetical protein
MTIIAGFSIGFAFSEFNQPEQLSSTKDIILAHPVLYKNMLAGILVILLLDLLVSFTLYKYFKNDSRKISLVAGILRVIYTLTFGMAAFNLAKNLNIHEVSIQMIQANFQSFQSIWSIGLVIFGCHLILIGFLMKLHKRIPKILWYLTLIAGFSYVVVHLLKFTHPNSEFVSISEMILSLPMAIGELSLAIWLIIRGGKNDKPMKVSIAKE